MGHAPPTQRARAASQTENVSAKGDTDSRNPFRTLPYGRATVAGPAPYTSTPGDIENAFRKPSAGWPAYEVMFPIGNST